MRVALYVRVSTQDQNHALQLLELEQYAAAHGWTMPEASTMSDRSPIGKIARLPETLVAAVERHRAAQQEERLLAGSAWFVTRNCRLRRLPADATTFGRCPFG